MVPLHGTRLLEVNPKLRPPEYPGGLFSDAPSLAIFAAILGASSWLTMVSPMSMVLVVVLRIITVPGITPSLPYRQRRMIRA
jgi:hypothetical protein